ncbi:hypothetical protein DFH06DRAFT_1345845 [Mycena polygramma]|nr:hypothetical protein DFH06DRAFT_1345845 [Mycena polygramma]
MPPQALQIQEICDHICDFLPTATTSTYHADLSACALISPIFTSSAQRHIFRRIALFPSLPLNLARAARSLRSVLQESPHLIRFIRDLSIEANCDVMVPLLAGLQFTHLETFSLIAPIESTPPDYLIPILHLVASIIALPSVQNIYLHSLTCDIASLCALFHQRTATLDSVSLHHVKITHLLPTATVPASEGARLTVNRLVIFGQTDAAWLLHPLCPLDFSALEELYCPMTAGTMGVMRAARSSLHTLNVDCLDTPGHHARDFTGLPDFPVLTALHLSTGVGSATPAIGFLSSIGSTPLLQYLKLKVYVLARPTLDEESLRRLDAAIVALDVPLRRVDMNVFLLQGTKDSEQLLLIQGVKGLMPRSNTKGYLRLSYTRRASY